MLMITIFCVGLVSAQRTITGTVTDDAGEPLISATVIAVGFDGVGALTEFDGTYSLEVPQGATQLEFSYTGYTTKVVDLGSSNVVDVTMASGELLDEIVVTGVAAGTSRKKLSFNVAKLGEEQLKNVPQTSAAGAIQGKVAGATVVSASGTPGAAPSIRLRGYSGLTGSQAPLILVDGVILEGTLADVNMEDVKNIEVVKGAAASALYGSRAANGVIVIETNRGAGGSGTQIKYRGEYGVSNLAYEMELSQHHAYKLAGSQPSTHTAYEGVEYNADGLPISGGRALDDDHYADNPYTVNNNPYEEFYRQGVFATNYLSVGNSTDKTNYLASFQRQDQEGIIFGTTGFKRNNIRFNLDHSISDKLLFSTSNLIVNSKEDRVGGAGGRGSGSGPFFDILFVEPDMNLLANNEEDGTPYNVDANVWANQPNPLYAVTQIDNQARRASILHSSALKYDATDWLTLDAQYSYEKRNNTRKSVTPKGYLSENGAPGVATKGLGSLTNIAGEGNSQKVQAGATLRRAFDKLNTTARLQYLFEDNQISGNSISGTELAFKGITNVENALTTTASSYVQQEKAINYSGIIDLDYNDRYIASVLVRRDGSSLFGENQRWQNYYRVSGAYRLGMDLGIEKINELKIHAAYGTAGIRPGFAAQYETWSLSAGGNASAALQGNKDLRPSTSKELEMGILGEMFNNFLSFEFTYAKTKVEDSFWAVNLPSSLSGFPRQWQNIGDLDTDTYEASLGLNLISNADMNLRTNFVFSTGQTVITKLGIPPTQTGTNNAFFFREGEKFGIIYGREFLTSLDKMSAQLGEGESISDYEINSDGYVIPAGTAGTTAEVPVQLDANMDGNPDQTIIGDINPDFSLSWGTNFNWKGFSTYMLWDMKQGGDVYWQTGQWIYREQRSADFDQSGKAEGDKKTVDYYAALYDVNNTNNYFVRDGSYIKLREFSVYYDFGKSISNAVKFVDGVKVGLVGRNLLTFTDFPGFDPEVGSSSGGINWGFDGFGYPNFRTVTGSVQVTF